MEKPTLEMLQEHPGMIERIAAQARRERALAIKALVVRAVRRLFRRAPAHPAGRRAPAHCA